MSSRTSPYDLEHVSGYPDALQIYRIQASRFWQVRYFIGRKYLRKSTRSENKADAIKFAKRFFDELKIAERMGFDIHRDTFAACADKLMKRQQAMVGRDERDSRLISEDRKKLDKDILPFFGNKAVADINTNLLDDYVDHLTSDRKLSASTLNKHLVVIRKVLNEARRNGYLHSLPVFPTQKRKDNPRPYFTGQELYDLLLKATELAKDDIKVRGVPLTLEIREFIAFATMVFVRPSDLKQLKHSHIRTMQFKEDGKVKRYLSIIPPNSKTVVRESISMPEAVKIYERLKKVHQAHGLAGPDDYVFFPNYRNREYALATIRRQFEYVVKEAGLAKDRFGNKRTLYSLRHSALMYRILTGDNVDIFTLAKNALTSVDQLERFYLSHAEPRSNVKNLLSERYRET